MYHIAYGCFSAEICASLSRALVPHDSWAPSCLYIKDYHPYLLSETAAYTENTPTRYRLHPVARSPLCSPRGRAPGTHSHTTHHAYSYTAHTSDKDHGTSASAHKRTTINVTHGMGTTTRGAVVELTVTLPSPHAQPRHRGKAKGVVLASGRHRPTGHTQSQTHGDSQDVQCHTPQ